MSYETGKIMKKDIIKSLIAIKQSEIPFDVIERDVKLPINRKKIITVPGVRRCGKSTLMEIAINNLIRDGVPSKNILWLGFDTCIIYYSKRTSEIPTDFPCRASIFKRIASTSTSALS